MSFLIPPPFFRVLRPGILLSDLPIEMNLSFLISSRIRRIIVLINDSLPDSMSIFTSAGISVVSAPLLPGPDPTPITALAVVLTTLGRELRAAQAGELAGSVLVCSDNFPAMRYFATVLYLAGGVSGAASLRLGHGGADAKITVPEHFRRITHGPKMVVEIPSDCMLDFYTENDLLVVHGQGLPPRLPPSPAIPAPAPAETVECVCTRGGTVTAAFGLRATHDRLVDYYDLCI